ncbi:MAG: T9SS type A sorting domain-containing protein [Ignavibacteria bacterium]|nr:T9SS type A sorting domain-containing protein [Ignavibacteria bacterium]
MGDKKVFYSDNRGDSWTQINEGLPADSYFRVFNSVNGRIFGGTGNIGVMVYDNPTSITSEVEIAGGFDLHQNYPNPFNPVTVIRYSLSENLFTSLKIYDILGNEIVTLVNEKLNAGSYETEFDAGDLTSGIYYYRIVSGNFIETKSMMLVK